MDGEEMLTIVVLGGLLILVSTTLFYTNMKDRAIERLVKQGAHPIEAKMALNTLSSEEKLFYSSYCADNGCK